MNGYVRCDLKGNHLQWDWDKRVHRQGKLSQKPTDYSSDLTFYVWPSMAGDSAIAILPSKSVKTN
ncbi:MAG: hypothetical protein P8X55_04915 [Desulfosarcinaceae bacterium]